MRAWLDESYPGKNYVEFDDRTKKDPIYVLISPVDTTVRGIAKKPEKVVTEKNALQKFKERIHPPEPPVLIGIDSDRNMLYNFGHEKGVKHVSKDGNDFTMVETPMSRIFIPESKEDILINNLSNVYFFLCNSDTFEKEKIDDEELERWRAEKIEQMKSLKVYKGKEIVVSDDAYPRKTIVTLAH